MATASLSFSDNGSGGGISCIILPGSDETEKKLFFPKKEDIKEKEH